MSQPTTKKLTKEFDDYECGNGPRPPVPGEESQLSKMTTEGASNSTSSSNSNPTPETDTAFARIEKWQESFVNFLADQEAVKLLLQFVREEGGIRSINETRLLFYFAVEGLKQHRDEKKIRRLIRMISDGVMKECQIQVPPELRETITGIIQSKIPPNTNVFDDLQKQVGEIIAATSYRAFLQSDMFIRYAQDNKKELDTKPISNTSQTNSSDLQTLHEDTELNLSDGSNLTKTTTDRPLPKLTEDRRLKTERRRLEVRPPGAYSFAVGSGVSFNTSYNPVSRIDSAIQSSDSEMNSKDGRPYFYRKPTSAEHYRRSAEQYYNLNPPDASQKTPIKPLSSKGLKNVGLIDAQTRLEQAQHSVDPSLLCKKLKELEASILDQSILDRHVSRVFSPQHRSPGNISPKQFHRHHHRSNEMSTSMPDFVATALRHSKSIPEHASVALLGTTTKKLAHKWPSQNVDSGISLYSADIPYKVKETKPTMEQMPDETMHRPSKNDLRKMRKQVSTHPSHQTNSLPRMNDENYTIVQYTYKDEELPYRSKIAGKHITLKQFKDQLPRKGNYRYFFQTICDDNLLIQEEVVSDMDVLPLYEGKIHCTISIDN